MDDLISRQAAIDAIERLQMPIMRSQDNVEQFKFTGMAEAREAIIGLPSAQVEIVYCGECKHMMPNGKCRQFADSTIRPSASDFCSGGERKDNE